MDIDQSLDDIIKTEKKSKRATTAAAAGRGGKGKGRGGKAGKAAPAQKLKKQQQAGAGRGRGRGRGGATRGGVAKRGSPYVRGAVPSVWSHDMYPAAGAGASARAAGGLVSRSKRTAMATGGATDLRSLLSQKKGGKAKKVVALSTGTKLTVKNLFAGVTKSDMQELFGAIGTLKSVKMVAGGALVVFSKRADALKAQKKYHTVALDGVPMAISVEKAAPKQDQSLYASPAARRNPVRDVRFTIGL